MGHPFSQPSYAYPTPQGSNPVQNAMAAGAVPAGTAGAGDVNGDGIITPDEDPDVVNTRWYQAGYKNKQDWRDAGKPMADGSGLTDAPFQSLYSGLRNQMAWNPNPAHAPNVSFAAAKAAARPTGAPSGLPYLAPHI